MHNGDCLEVLKTLPENSVDSICTDPPYGLSFMGAKWDCNVPKKEIWEQVFRVLKPGGHLLAFFGSRTYHRGAVEIEDAGFEIRDQIMWIHGQGFPKSLDISKEIDKMEGTWRGRSTEVIESTVGQVAKGTEYIREDKGEPISDDAKKWSGWGTNLKPAHEPIVLARKPVEEDTVTENVLKYGTGSLNIDESRVGESGATKRSHQESYGEGGRADQGGTQAWRTGHDIVELNMGRFPANVILSNEKEVLEGFPHTKSGAMKHTVEAYEGESITGFLRGKSGPHNQHGDEGSAGRFFKQIEPEHEPIVLARKPIVESTVTKNVLEHGTGGLNIDESRVPLTSEDTNLIEGITGRDDGELDTQNQGWGFKKVDREAGLGRFPANVITDGSEKVIENFPYSKDGVSVNRNRNGKESSGNTVYGDRNKDTKDAGYGGEGSAARFFYCAKPSPSEKKKGMKTQTNLHPTVKPIKLMEYLVNMITPKGGTVLDPFMGSGSTGIAAAINLDFNFIGIELSKEYFEIAKERLANLEKEKNRLVDLGFILE